MLVLGIESSCDETAAAVLERGRVIRSSVVAGQEDIHARYGGVVPELASRAHMQRMVPTIDLALQRAGVGLKDLDGIAVTQGPGLLGSLLVGLCTAKSMAMAAGIPLTGVDHLEAHVIANFATDSAPAFPFTSLVVSGGHTNLYFVQDYTEFRLLGQTRDDAAGEAFDKVAKLLDLGYPGGVIIDALAKEGDPSAVPFPRAMIRDASLDFSFSGLKTAVITHVRRHPLSEADSRVQKAHIAASFQEAVVDVLVAKALRAAAMNRGRDLVLAGGVAANTRLRRKLEGACREAGVRLFVPPPSLCTDNAVGVAALGTRLLERGIRASFELDAYSRSPAKVFGAEADAVS